MSDPHEHLTEHEFDGIREYDNPTPGWWHFIFIGSVVFSVIYVAFWHFSPLAWSIQESWTRDRDYWVEQKFGELGDLEPTEETMLRMMNTEWLSIGKSTFLTHCASCHMPDGRGSTGPNMTDDHYLWVESLPDFYDVIAEGRSNGAMPAQKNRLHPNQIVLVAAYAASLRGTDVPGGKAPEGDVIPPWPEYQPEGDATERSPADEAGAGAG